MNIKLTEAQKKKMLCSDDIYSVMQRILMRESKIDRNREHFWTISLDYAHHILNIELVSMGSFKETIAEPMEVFSVPLQKRAAKVILIHNHPSGEIKPSDNDKDLTDRLIQVGRIMKVPVLDHLVISEKSYYSFDDSGLLKELQASTKYVPAYEMKKRYEKAALEKGEEKGEQKGRVEVARVMKERNYPIEVIMELTGLSEKSIKLIKLKKD